MKVFAISDLHLSVNNPKPMDIFGPVWQGYLDKIFEDWKQKVSEEDVVLLCGDLSWAMNIEQVKEDFKLLENLPGKKILIRGNHDYWWKSISAVRNILPKNFFAIQNDSVKFNNIVFCGTRGWTVPDKNIILSDEDLKIYKREIIRLDLTLSSANKIRETGDKLICLMHFPPINFLRQDNEISSLFQKYNVDAVVYGHLHGVKKIDLNFLKENTYYYLTSCDIVSNKLVQIL